MATVATAAVLAAGVTVAVEREQATRTVVADCTHPASRSWRLGALELAGCQVWRVAHAHHAHRPGRHPAHPVRHRPAGRRAV